MKVIVVEHNWNEPADDTIKAHLMADSAIMTTGKPFFLPDVVPQLEARLTWAVRVEKLGKYVARKFAPRYYSHCTAAIVATPAAQCGQPLTAAIDGALMLGNWVPVDRDAQPAEVSLDMACNGTTVCTATTATLNHPIDEVIEYVSRYCTLKTGDIILTGLHPQATPMTRNDRFRATVDGNTVLEVRVK